MWDCTPVILAAAQCALLQHVLPSRYSNPDVAVDVRATIIARHRTAALVLMCTYCYCSSPHCRLSSHVHILLLLVTALPP
jgi:hypothetical protein